MNQIVYFAALAITNGLWVVMHGCEGRAKREWRALAIKQQGVINELAAENRRLNAQIYNGGEGWKSE